ncbi:hypothetical protein B0H67DRAFT_614022 [Lasiosphaeris hirsuta]|uniref:Uncharacterized protein n=1 Tax=Lasiosphaeris hirsuta TaxID=260670 RepID=A0AA39ZSE2_9PEZI|nr:hypothetical protein B0H67DRAFT_614022 [Lasiosphaeris hirsuta]
MAEAFALAASAIGVIAFMQQLWTDVPKIPKSSSSVSTSDCTRQAKSLQAHCDRVRSLQVAEIDTEEAKRIKEITTEIREVTEALSSRLTKCTL